MNESTPCTAAPVADLELARRAAAGDRAASAIIHERCAGRVRALVARMLPEVQDREDVAQDVFLHVHRHLADFRGGSCLSTWIHRIACNVCLQHRRRMGRRREMPLERAPVGALSDGPAARENAPERVADRRRVMGRVAAALERLPASQRLVMALGPLQGLTYEEIAQRLGVSVDVVKGRLHRGRAALRRLVGPDAPQLAHAA